MNLKTVFEFLGKDLKILFGIAFFTNTIALMLPVFTLNVYDRVIPFGAIQTLYAFVAILFISILFEFVFKKIRSDMLLYYFEKLQQDGAQKVCDYLLSHKRSRNSPLFLQFLIRDVELLSSFLSGNMLILIFDTPFTLIFIALVFYLSPTIGALLLFIIAIIVLIAMFFVAKSLKLEKQESEKLIEKEILVQNILTGQNAIFKSSSTRFFVNKYTKLHSALSAFAAQRVILNSSISHINGSILFASSVLIVSVGSFEVISQSLSMGALIACNMLAQRAINPITQLSSSFFSLLQILRSAQRVSRIKEVQEKQKLEIREVSALALTNIKGDICNKKEILFERGKLNVVTGDNGSGKSTLLEIAANRFENSFCELFLDNVNANSIKNIENLISFASQEPFVFEGSIIENIKMNNDISDEKMLGFAKRIGFDKSIAKTKNGFETNISAASSSISFSQKKGIALLRVFCSDSPVLIIDDPTAGLDRESSVALCDTIVELSKNLLVVVSSMTQYLVERADTLVILKDGKIYVR